MRIAELFGTDETDGVIQEARKILAEEGITANQLQIRWIVPLHGEAIQQILKASRRTIIIENNYSGQFARYLRSETSFVPDGYIRKYDGEPFMPHHIVEAVKEQLAGTITMSVPMHEIAGRTPELRRFDLENHRFHPQKAAPPVFSTSASASSAAQR